MLSMCEDRAEAKETTGNCPWSWATSRGAHTGKAGTVEQCWQECVGSPRKLRGRSMGLSLPGIIPPSYRNHDRCEQKASFGPRVHGNSISIFKQLPAQVLPSVWGKPQVPSSQALCIPLSPGQGTLGAVGFFLVYIWCLVWLWLPIQNELVIDYLYNSF